MTMFTHYTFLALDLAAQRTAEADRYRLAAAARAERHEVSRLRRLVARAAVAVARAADETIVESAPTAA
jgi:hypothetical protein